LAKERAKAAEELRIANEKIAKQNAEAAEKARILREAAEKQRREEKAKQDAILEAERQKRLKIEKELADKVVAELRAKQDEEDKKEADLARDDKSKLVLLVIDLQALKTKYQFKSAKSRKAYSDTGLLLDKIINHINK